MGRSHKLLPADSTIAARLSNAEPFRPAYWAARLRVLAQPVDDREAPVLDRLAGRFEVIFGLDSGAAKTAARRNLLFSRDRFFHETLLLSLRSDRLGELLDALEVEGSEHLHAVPPGRGVLLLSLGYSLFTSLLWLWLTRAAARGIVSHLTIRTDYGKHGAMTLPEQRLRELEAAGLFAARATTLVRLWNTPGAMRQLTARLSSGGAMLILPVLDESPPPPLGRPVPSIRLGQRQAALPRGLDWLVRSTRSAVLPLHIRPRDNGHAIVIGPPVCLEENGDVIPVVRDTLQTLVDQTILSDPGPWTMWRQPGLPEPGSKGEASPILSYQR